VVTGFVIGTMAFETPPMPDAMTSAVETTGSRADGTGKARSPAMTKNDTTMPARPT
jgi:hypothetical protein